MNSRCKGTIIFGVSKGKMLSRFHEKQYKSIPLEELYPYVGNERKEIYLFSSVLKNAQ